MTSTPTRGTRRSCVTELAFTPARRYGVPMKERYKELALTYGWVFVAMVFLTLVVSVLAFFVAISAGVDVPALLARVGWKLDEGATGPSTFLATLFLAYAATKVLSFPRYALAAALTPIAARLIQKYRPQWLKKATAKSDPGAP